MIDRFSPNFPKCLPHQIIIPCWSPSSSEQSLTLTVNIRSGYHPAAPLVCQKSCFLPAPQTFPDFINEWVRDPWHTFAMSGTPIL